MTITTRRHRTEPQSGAALLFVLVIMGLMMAMATGLATRVRVDTLTQAGFEEIPRHFYAAEAGLNRGMAEFREIFLDLRLPAGSDFDTHTFSLAGENVEYVLDEVAGNPRVTTLPAGDVFAGMNSIQYRYSALSETVDGAGNPEAQLAAEFDVNNVPIFQFVAFYNEDLEILPGPDMFLHGRVHTNGDLYLNANANLRIEDQPPDMTTAQVSTAERLFRGRKDRSECTGTVAVDMLADADNSGDLDRRTLPCSGGNTRQVPVAEAAAWQGSLLVGIENINAPQPDIIARGTGIFWERADLRIVLNLEVTEPTNLVHSSGPANLFAIEVQNQNGTRDVARTNRLYVFMRDVPGKIFYSALPRNTSCNPDEKDCYDPPFRHNDDIYRRADDGNVDPEWYDTWERYDYRRGAFWNHREGNWMRLLNIDLQALLDWNRAQASADRLFDPDDASDGGIVLFTTVQGPSSVGQNNYGVRLFDSADLGFPTGLADPTGVTVVTDQAVYVEGNFNSVDKTPAAVIGDSLNVLSANWEIPVGGRDNDAKSRRTNVDDRPASNTVINAAFISGVDRTTVGNYNGGLENYPRFHENWTNRTLTYRGSFVSLGRPDHVDGGWVYGSPYYTAPIRAWDYDVHFNDVARLPPLTPRFVFVQQILFSQTFR